MSFSLFNFQSDNRQNAYLLLSGIKTLPINTIININVYHETNVVTNLRLIIKKVIRDFVFSVTLVTTNIPYYYSYLPYIVSISYDAKKNKLTLKTEKNITRKVNEIYEIIEGYNLTHTDRITYSIIKN